MTFTQEIKQHNKLMTEQKQRIKELEKENTDLKKQIDILEHELKQEQTMRKYWREEYYKRWG